MIVFSDKHYIKRYAFEPAILETKFLNATLTRQTIFISCELVKIHLTWSVSLTNFQLSQRTCFKLHVAKGFKITVTEPEVVTFSGICYLKEVFLSTTIPHRHFL
jgi:hypothetical protein